MPTFANLCSRARGRASTLCSRARGRASTLHAPLLRLSLTAATACLVACGPPPPSARDTLPALKNALDEPVSSVEQNKANSQLVVQVSEYKHIEGFSRLEVEEKLGKGAECSEHPICKERGFYPDDWYYEVGREGSSYVRHRPALIVGFNRFGKVDRTFVLEVR